jgi:HaeIII restriction endonuclease
MLFRGTALEGISATKGAEIYAHDFTDNARMKHFFALSQDDQDQMEYVANIGMTKIIGLENLGNKSFKYSEITSCAIAKHGDTSDFKMYYDEAPTLSVSCKHNNKSFKHHRTSANTDCLRDWGIDATISSNYFYITSPIFAQLTQTKAFNPIPWNKFPHVQNMYSKIVGATFDELEKNLNTPERIRGFLDFIFSKFDHYILSMIKKQAHVRCINFQGTLAGAKNVYPTLLIRAHRIRNNAFQLDFNHDISIRLRIHTASGMMESSFKWDVTIPKLPTSTERR